MYIIYKHTNTITGLSYIGYTKNGMEVRWSEHCGRALKRKIKLSFKFDNALRKYPESTWIHEILLKDIPSLEEAQIKEIEMIALYDTFKNGYNSCLGGGGCERTPEMRLKLSEAKKSNHNMLGKHHSEETKKRMSLAAMGNKRCLGRKHSEETKKKISETEKKSKQVFGKIPKDNIPKHVINHRIKRKFKLFFLMAMKKL